MDNKNINIPQLHNEYLNIWTHIYENSNYNKGLAAYFLKMSHYWAEKKFDQKFSCDKVLEVGAASGIHIDYVRHQYNRYYMTDIQDCFLHQAKGKKLDKVKFQLEDATKLSFKDNYFDRLIATHVLEHIPNPYDILLEWVRVIKPGGYLTIVLPCDPGIAWRLGRNLFVRNRMLKLGIDYDYWMAREHINPINNLLSFIRTYFNDYSETWKPFNLPSMDLNLFYIAHIRV